MPSSPPAPEHNRELVLRFASFLFRAVEDFPASGAPLQRAIGAEALSLVEMVLREDPKESLLRPSGTGGLESTNPHRMFLGPAVARRLGFLETYLRVARDSGCLSFTLHYIAQDVVRELGELIWDAEASFLEGGVRQDDIQRHAPHPAHAESGTSAAPISYDVPHSVIPHESGIPSLVRDREAAILMLLKEKNPRRFKEIRPHFAVSDRAIRKDLARLVAEGRVARRGQPPQSWYELS